MLTVDEILHNVEAYQRNRMSLKDFEQWFEDHSIEADEASELKKLRIAVDGALAEYHFDHIGEDAFREELAAAARPFGNRIVFVDCKPQDASPWKGAFKKPLYLTATALM